MTDKQKQLMKLIKLHMERGDPLQAQNCINTLDETSLGLTDDEKQEFNELKLKLEELKKAQPP